MVNLKERLKKGLIIFAALNLALFYSLTGFVESAQAATCIEFKIDNSDAGFKAYEGSDYLIGQGVSSDGHYVTWTPTVEQLKYFGKWEVSAKWTSDPNLRGIVNYTVFHNEGSGVISADQRINGGQWNHLGTFEFKGEGNEYVRLDNNRAEDTKELVVADAVQFKLVDAYPQVPTPLSPADGSYTNDNTPLLDWSDVVDPLGDDIYYNYQVRTGSEDGPVVWNYYNHHNSYLNNSQLQAGTTPDNVYYWQVRAIDENGNESDWSVPSKLTIDTKAPEVEILKADPAIAGRTVFKEGRNEKINLDSEVSDKTSGIDSLIWSLNGTVIFDQQSGISKNFYTDTPGSYTLTLTVKDKAGNQAADTLDLYFENQLPDEPVLSLTRDDGIIKLTWNKVKGTRGYQIIRNGQPIQDTNNLLDKNTTQYIDYVENGKSYEYRVRAYDIDEGYTMEYTRSNHQSVYVPQPEVRIMASTTTSAIGGRVVADDAPSFRDGEVKAEEDNDLEVIEDGEVEDAREEGVEETSEEARTNWPMIIAIIIAATIVLGGAAYWWYGISEDEDQI